MATINREALSSIDTSKDESTAQLTARDYGPPLDLKLAARNLGAFDLGNTVGKFDPEKITMKQRSQMRRDPMIALGLHFRKATLVNSPWHIECDDRQIAAFVENALRDIYPRTFAQIFMALEWGYIPIVKRFERVVPEWQYETESGETLPVWPDKNIPAVVWATSRPLPPNGAEVILRADRKTFAGFKHPLITKADGTELTVPASHALWVTHQFDENFGDWYGYPLTGYAFRYWWSYWYQWLLADRHMEQDADPPVKVSYPPGSSPHPETGTQTSNYAIALRAGQMIRDGATIAVPSDFYEIDATGSLARGARKWDIEFIRGGENIRAFHDSFQYLDVMKLRAMLVPDQALTGARGALSGNVAETYSVAFAESQAVLAQWIDQVINDYMIPDLVAQNFVDAPPCKKVTERFRDEDARLANRLLEIVAASDPSALQLNYREIVKTFNLPVLSPEEVERARREKFEEAQRMASLKNPNDPGAGERGTTESANEGADNPRRTRIADARENA